MQVLATEAPVVAEYLPASQLIQAEVLTFEYLPAPQVMQVLATEAPVVAEYVPAAQSAHVFHVAAVNEVNTPARTHR
jgi:hypothetical protein